MREEKEFNMIYKKLPCIRGKPLTRGRPAAVYVRHGPLLKIRGEPRAGINMKFIYSALFGNLGKEVTQVPSV